MQSSDAQVLVEVLLIVTFLDGEILELPIDEKMWVLGTSWHLREQLTNRKKDVLSIIVPDGVRTITRWVFEGCTALTSVTLPYGVTSIESKAFAGCTSLLSIALPETVMTIGECAFYRCTSLVSITIPEGVTTIEWHTFDDCTSLVSVTIPRGVTVIRRDAFKSCTSLTSVTLPDGVTKIGARAFYDCTSLVSITLPETMTVIGNSAFQKCISLSSMKIPTGVTFIGNCAFVDCISLVTIAFPENVETIHAGVLSGCRSLVSVVLPPSCDLRRRAIFKCKRLSFVVAPGIFLDPPPSIGPSVKKENFQRCPNLSGPTYTTPRSPSAVATALGLEYWTPMTHHLCRTHVRSQVAHMILVLFRLELPIVVILKILRMFKRHEIGPPLYLLKQLIS